MDAQPVIICSTENLGESRFFLANMIVRIGFSQNEERICSSLCYNSVYVFDDKPVLVYNSEEGAESVTLSEAEEVFSSDLSQEAPPWNGSL